METLLIVTQQQKEEIRKYYNINEQQIKQDIEIIITWKEKQPHLPQDMTDDFIEKVLLRNKFRVERTKEKLDNYFSVRGSNTDLISGFETIVPTEKPITYLPMPVLAPNFERIVILKYTNPDPNVADMLDTVKLNLGVEELCIRYDYGVGVRYFFDLDGFTLRHLAKMGPILTAKLVILLEKAYSQRILGIEFLNFPLFGAKFLSLMKLILRGKIYDRIRIHNNMESVYKVIPKEYLPVDYGGSQPPIPELLAKWDKVMKSHRDFFVKNYEKVSMEHLRVQTGPSDAFGVDGTFKKLTID